MLNIAIQLLYSASLLLAQVQSNQTLSNEFKQYATQTATYSIEYATDIIEMYEEKSATSNTIEKQKTHNIIYGKQVENLPPIIERIPVNMSQCKSSCFPATP